MALAGRVLKKPCFKHVQCFGAPVLRIAERLPKAISLDEIKSLEYHRNRIELSVTRETAKQRDREIELRPRRVMRPIQDHGVRGKPRQNISLNVFLPVWTVLSTRRAPAVEPSQSTTPTPARREPRPETVAQEEQ